MVALRYVVVILATLACQATQAQIAVIVNRAAPAADLSVREIRDLYLGRNTGLGDGRFALVLDQPRDAPVRERFFRLIAGMSPAQVNAYWSRLTFSGQVVPPQALADEAAVLKAVRASPTAIGYISADRVDPTVKVVLLLKE